MPTVLSWLPTGKNLGCKIRCVNWRVGKFGLKRRRWSRRPIDNMIGLAEDIFYVSQQRGAKLHRVPFGIKHTAWRGRREEILGSLTLRWQEPCAGVLDCVEDSCEMDFLRVNSIWLLLKLFSDPLFPGLTIMKN